MSSYIFEQLLCSHILYVVRFVGIILPAHIFHTWWKVCFFVKDVTNFWMEIFALLLACNMTHTYKLENKTRVFMLTKLLNKIWYCLPQKLIQKYAYGKRFNCLRNITNFSLYSIINCPFVVLLYITAIIIIFCGEIISSTWNFVEIYISIKICIFIIW